VLVEVVELVEVEELVLELLEVEEAAVVISARTELRLEISLWAEDTAVPVVEAMTPLRELRREPTSEVRVATSPLRREPASLSREETAETPPVRKVDASPMASERSEDSEPITSGWGVGAGAGLAWTRAAAATMAMLENFILTEV